MDIIFWDPRNGYLKYAFLNSAKGVGGVNLKIFENEDVGLEIFEKSKICRPFQASHPKTQQNLMVAYYVHIE